MDDIKEEIRKLAFDAGFDDVGFCRAETSPQAKADLKEFNAKGYHGTMDWMVNTEERRADPQVLWEEAKSIIVLGLNYGPKEDPMALLDQPERGVISCYAKNRDYHDLIKKRLKRMARAMVEKWGGALKVFVDTAPVMEKAHCRANTLGLAGKAYMCGFSQLRIMALFGRDLHDVGINAGRAPKRSLREMYQLLGQLPHRCLCRCREN